MFRQMSGVPVQVPGKCLESISDETSDPISFAQRFARSNSFDSLFRDGMTLVEEVADYLDGEGRKAARGLKPPLSVIYATESMRMTTRLLEAASWLVVQRSLKDGEISPEEAQQKRERVKLRRMSDPETIKQFSQLPPGLQALIVRTVALLDRLMQLDDAFRQSTQPAPDQINPIAGQFQRLTAAFGRVAN
ncbi:MAG: DUF1465 family protein [Pseudomonadota bacterium]